MKFIVSSSALLKQLQHISGVINANTVLPILEDFLFEVEKNKITVVATDLETVMRVQLEIVATDAHRLVRYKRTDASSPKTDSFIVPRKPLNLLKSALPDNEDEITLSYNNNHLFVRHGTTQMSCRLIDARFPDYKVVIPTDN